MQKEALKTRCCLERLRPAKEQCSDSRCAHLVRNNIDPTLNVLWVDLACDWSGREVEGDARQHPSINRPAAADTARAARSESRFCMEISAASVWRVIVINRPLLTSAGPRQQAGDQQHSERRPHI